MAISAIGSSGFSLSQTTIDRYEADVTLDANGDMTVVERWDMDYSSELYVRFRDIAYSKYAEGYPLYEDSGNTADFVESAASVRVIKDGEDITYKVRTGYSWENDRDEYGEYITCYPYRLYCESIFTELWYPEDALGKVTFEYEYKIAGAVTQYSDISELNWMLFEYAEGKIKAAEVTVHLPANLHTIDDVFVWGHSLASGTIEIVDSDEIVMNLDNVGKTDYIEFRILMENDLFPAIDARNVVLHPDMNFATLSAYEAELADETNMRILIAQIVLYAAIAGVAVMGFLTVRVYRKYDKEYEPRFTADYYRDLPGDETPAEVSYLYYMKKINDEDVTATLLDMIRRKFVEIDYQGQDTTSKDAEFSLRLVAGKDRSQLLSHEAHLLDWFFNHIGNGTSVSTERIESYGKSVGNAERFQNDARQFSRLAKRAGEKRDFFEKTLAADKNRAFANALLPGGLLAASLLTGAAFSLDNTVAALISGIVLVAYAIYVATIQKRSVNGNEEFVKWRAFRKFLVEFGRFNDYPMPSIIVWEHYLVYATSLKCADLVMDQLRVKLPVDEETMSQATFMGAGYRMRGFYFGYALGRFQRSYTTARTNVQQTIVAANAAKAGSGGHGGGFGGGRSFGGGGGGGRSR